MPILLHAVSRIQREADIKMIITNFFFHDYNFHINLLKKSDVDSTIVGLLTQHIRYLFKTVPVPTFVLTR